MVLTPCETRFAKTSAPSVSRLRRSPFSLSSKRRVAEDHAPRPRGRPVVVNEREREPGEALGELLRVGYRGAREHEAGSPPCSSATRRSLLKHGGDVGAEDAAQDVGLVDGDDLQVAQEVGPGLVVGQDADVEHVGVGEKDVGAAPDVRA